MKIVEIATKEIGYTEDPPDSNRTKYGQWFGLDGVAWCAIFVSWCYAQAGAALGNIGFTKGMAGCQTAVNHFKSTGEVVTEPSAGDIVFFDWNKDGRFDHTGIFVEWIEREKGTFRTIEGNTSFTNQSNGGQVMKRIRNINSPKVIFVHPKVADQIQ